MRKWMAAATAQCAEMCKKYRDRGDRESGRAAQERRDDARPASEVKSEKI